MPTHCRPARPAAGFYDNELLDVHLIGGDGRLNENYTLTTVHAVFFAEHQRLVSEIQALVASKGATYAAQWTGEMYFQAAKLVNETQYQRIVFDEYVSRLTPNLDQYAGYVSDARPGHLGGVRARRLPLRPLAGHQRRATCCSPRARSPPARCWHAS